MKIHAEYVTYSILPPLGQYLRCLENLIGALSKWGVNFHDIPDYPSLNVFMNGVIDGKIRILPPTSKAGGYLVFLGNVDVLVELSVCATDAGTRNASNANLFG